MDHGDGRNRRADQGLDAGRSRGAADVEPDAERRLDEPLVVAARTRPATRIVLPHSALDRRPGHPSGAPAQASACEPRTAS